VYNDYQLVEIEAPIRELFRRDGQQKQELTHAINQITDWVQYIQDNKQKVEQELGLYGISTNPRTLVVIGRSASLTIDNRRKLETLQAQQNKLRIITYDDVLSNAKESLSRILGNLDIQGHNLEIYYSDK
jgi:2-succinyl-5-enolpyruvyl-6-hydroxy-3-cyclohexene-1-carboxylate synthase